MYNPFLLREQVQATVNVARRPDVQMLDSEVWREPFGFISQEQSKWDTSCLPHAVQNAAIAAGTVIEADLFQLMHQEALKINGMTFPKAASLLAQSQNINGYYPNLEWIKNIYTFSTDTVEPQPLRRSSQNQPYDTGMSRLECARLIKDRLDMGDTLAVGIDNEKFYHDTTYRHPNNISGHAISIVGYKVKNGKMNVQIIDPAYGIGMIEVAHERLSSSLTSLPLILRKKA